MNKRSLISIVTTFLIPIFIYGMGVEGTVTSEKGSPLVELI